MGIRLFTCLIWICALSIPGHAARDLSSLSWGIDNQGEPQQILIDHYTSGVILGVKGEDIHDLGPSASATRPVRVAVLDTGVDSSHPALRSAIDGPGFNAITQSQDTEDTQGHGTHVAGIIAGRLNASGFRGVSQNARILPIKVVQTGPNAPIRPQDIAEDATGGAGTALTENVAKGMLYAIEKGAEVIHLSLAWPASIRSAHVDQAIELARQKNILIVSSAGNDSTQAEVYPCIYEEVICVGAHGPDGAFTHFSNFGSMVDLLAPGISILSLWPQKKAPVTFAGQVGFEFRNGTSMAAPFVSGALAELLSRGYSPSDARARLYLGTRPTAKNSRFKSELSGRYFPTVHPTEKRSRFGNLDMQRAVALTPRPLILPKEKGAHVLLWDGRAQQVTWNLPWINRWIDSKKVSIRIQGQEFKFDRIAQGETFITPVAISVDPDADSALEIEAEVSADEGPVELRRIPTSWIRTLSESTIPKEAEVTRLEGFTPPTDAELRSVVLQDPAQGPSFVFTRNGDHGLELSLIQKFAFKGTATIPSLRSDQLLNLYALADQTWVAIFSVQKLLDARPGFVFVRLNENFEPSNSFPLGTETTALSENFKWSFIHGEYSPLWVGFGFTPKLDLPAYDPWNSELKDLKSPKIFYLDQGTLRSVHLRQGLTPLFILPDLSVLATSGLGYEQSYSLLTLDQGQVVRSTPVSMPEYRMLIGANTAAPSFFLDGSKASGVIVSGPSTPGNLRVSLLQGPYFSLDRVLNRTTPLDSLVSVFAGFFDGGTSSYFVESHYDLLFYSSNPSKILSTSLNRYSYIPSMIFSKGFYGVVLKSSRSSGSPGIYIPATLANGSVSEIVSLDPNREKLIRPLRFRFKTDPSCTGVGNLIPAFGMSPAKQVFLCNSNRGFGRELSWIQVPLTNGE